MASTLFKGLTFALREPDAETSQLVETNGGRFVKADKLQDSTIVLISEQKGSKKKKKQHAADGEEEDEVFGEGYWKISTRWVQNCVLSSSLLDFEDGESGDTYLAARPPTKTANPLHQLLAKTFTADDDEALKIYATRCATKGFRLDDGMAVWEFVTKQPINRLSRFTPQQLKDRYISFGEATPTKKKTSSAAKPAAPAATGSTKRTTRTSVTAAKAAVEEDHDEDDEREEEAQQPKEGVMTAMKRKLRMYTQDAEEEEDEEPKAKKAKPAAAAPKVSAAKASSLSSASKKKPSAAKATTTTTTSTGENNGQIGRQDVKYSKEESDKMIEFAREHPTLTQREMWELAAEEGLLPGRSVVSMKKHFRKLDERLNRTRAVVEVRSKNFEAEEDQLMFLWVYNWIQEHQSEGIWGMRMWELAEKERLLGPGRTAEQMYNRFKNSLRKRLAAGLAEAESSTIPFEWTIPPRSGKKAARSPVRSTAASVTPRRGTVAATAVAKYSRAPHELKIVSDMLDRVRGVIKGKTVEEIFAALYFTCCDESAAIRVLKGEEMDSKFDLWTREEDRRLVDGQTVNRPDVHRRRTFLGLEPQTGL